SVGHRRLGGGDMMLIAMLAYKTEQLLKIRHFNNSISAERVELVLSKPAFSEVGRHSAPKIVGRDSTISKRPWTDTPYNRPEGVFFSNRARNDLLVVHFLLGKKRFWQVRAMKDHAFIWVGAEIVIPI